MYCSKCGKKIKSDSTFCTSCGNRIDDEMQKDLKQKVAEGILSDLKPYKKRIVIGVSILVFIIYFFGASCRAGICLFPQKYKGEYCFIHTCEIDKCLNRKAENKIYCYTHTPSSSISTKKNYTTEVPETVLCFSNVQVSHNSSYTVCNGTITNKGNKTYSFVEVKGKFQNSSGEVIDTDWTYAVGSEGLEPGESKTFRLSVDKNYDINKCVMEVIDYD